MMVVLKSKNRKHWTVHTKNLIQLFNTQSRLLKRLLKTLWKKKKMLETFFPQCFLLDQKEKMSFNLSSANAFILIMSKDLSFGKGLSPFELQATYLYLTTFLHGYTLQFLWHLSKTMPL